MSKKKKTDSRKIEIEFTNSHQRTIWSKISASERLQYSWNMRKLIKDIRAIHDKKIFPTP